MKQLKVGKWKQTRAVKREKGEMVSGPKLGSQRLDLTVGLSLRGEESGFHWYSLQLGGTENPVIWAGTQHTGVANGIPDRETKRWSLGASPHPPRASSEPQKQLSQ